MEHVEWDSGLETGDALVDEQHRGIFELFNEMAALEPDDTAALLPLADRLMQHVDTHFDMEEDLMVRGGYPRDDYEGHVREHRDLKEKARDAVLEFRRGAGTGRGPFIEFMRSWLLVHIETEDRKLVEHIRGDGVVRGPK